jgi:ATP adenylyltransferase
MEIIYSPWRSQYIENFDIENNTSSCFLCDAVNAFEDLTITSDDDIASKLLLVARRDLCCVIMNKYPYNAGHTLVVPKRHLSDFEMLTQEELLNIMQTIQEVVVVTKQICNPQGFNIGLNVGQAAGAGMPTHLHFHIVPRWNGDSNFTATIGDVKFVASALEDIRIKLANHLWK